MNGFSGYAFCGLPDPARPTGRCLKPVTSVPRDDCCLTCAGSDRSLGASRPTPIRSMTCNRPRGRQIRHGAGGRGRARLGKWVGRRTRDIAWIPPPTLDAEKLRCTRVRGRSARTQRSRRILRRTHPTGPRCSHDATSFMRSASATTSAQRSRSAGPKRLVDELGHSAWSRTVEFKLPNGGRPTT